MRCCVSVIITFNCAFYVHFLYILCEMSVHCMKAEQAELLGPLDVLTEFPSERLQQKLGYLFIDKGHPSANFWNNYRMLTTAYSAPASVTLTDEALRDFDRRGHKHVAAVPPVPDHVTINESMDRALRLAVLQPTPHLNDVIKLLAAAHQSLGALWTEYATSQLLIKTQLLS